MQEYTPAGEDSAPQAVPDEVQRLQEMLLIDQDGLLSATRVRLMRVAQARGVAPDAIDDVVQETLCEAWKHLDRLYAPAGFHVWIDEICRNICRRYAHRHAMDLLRSAPVVRPHPDYKQGAGEGQIDLLAEMCVADTPDPLEELCRQDLELLLERALGALPQATRSVVEMCHLLELPRTEVAARLHISSGALETRLHRARRQLRQILNGPLRSEAETFGLALDDEQAVGWHETRLWCPLCSRQRLQGCFLHPEVEEGPNLHLRCPDCSRRYGQDTIHSMGLVSLAGLRSFRPAWKRTMQGLTDRMMQALPRGLHPCLYCGKPASIEVRGRDTEAATSPGPYPFWIHWRCVHCGEALDSRGDLPSVDQMVYWSHSLTRQFVQQHPRSSSQPGIPVEHGGEPAIYFQIADLESSDHLNVLAHRRTLHVLASFA
ncbi:MAG: sigma-70 family RNA polymerase sigma factor [Chloroflexota bacterium]|nr:sigma-70 family RNA polymerase sigma factor [Chloroflexota bacterium]